MSDEPTGRARGGVARAAKLSPEERRAQAMKAVAAKAELAKLPRITHGSTERPLKIGDVEIPCYVLVGGTRVLSQRGLQTGIGMSTSGGAGGEQRLALFTASLAEKAKGNKDLYVRIADLTERLKNPIKFNPGGKPAYGYEATVLADLCDAVLGARAAGLLLKQQEHIAAQAEILVRGFARVGIIALVDEATGYQKDRARDALAKILEAYVAKELQPYVKTFEPDYYEHMFRLRGLPYPPDSSSSKPQYRPQYFGKLTNDIVYRRLAPGVLEALKEEGKKDAKQTHLHRRLTTGFGRIELIKHLTIVRFLMRRAKDWQEFMSELNKESPRFGDTIPIDLDSGDR